MKKLIGYFIGALLLVTTAPAVANEFQLATDIGANARQIAMGTIDGFSKDSTAIFENPAGLYHIKSKSASFFTATYLNEVDYNNMSFAKKTRFGTFGLGLMKVSISDNPVTGVDNAGEHVLVDSFTFNNWVLKTSYEKSIRPNIHWGVSFNTYGQTLDDTSGYGHNFDTGVIIIEGKNTISLAVKNLSINQNITFSDGSKEQLTTQYVAGIKHDLNTEWSLYGQYKFKEENSLFSAAVSYTPYFAPYCELLAGYKQVSIGNIEKDTTTLGFSLDLNTFKVAYCYEKSEHISHNSPNYFSVAIDF